MLLFGASEACAARTEIRHGVFQTVCFGKGRRKIYGDMQPAKPAFY